VLHAKLAAVGAVIDPVTHRLQVRATLPNADGRLRPGMFASFVIASGTESRSPAIPQSALVREGEALHVWVLGRGGELTLRPVRLGRARAGLFEVLAGLNAGERIVTHGSLFLDQAAQAG
jgi:cobalt-zinc-cadmium efflux system membrane fusion protein